MRIAVEVKRGYDAKVVLNNLYKQTKLESSFPCNMTALVDRKPLQMGLKAFLTHFLDFR